MGDVSNPKFANLSSAGSQWPEARGFSRMHGGNPFAQSRLLENLCGLYNVAWEGWNPNPEIEDDLQNQKLVLAGIAQTIRYYSTHFPEWQEETFELDSDFGFGTYHAETRLVDVVDWVLSQHEESHEA